MPENVDESTGAREALTHNTNNTATAGIWRHRRADGSVIVKHAAPPTGDGLWAAGAEPAHWNYWRREVLAYTTGFATEYLSGSRIRPPALLHDSPRPDGSVELTLEDVGGGQATGWSPDRLGGFAYQLGTVQARWAHPKADRPTWLSTGWIRQYAGRFGPDSAPDWDHPQLAAVWPKRLREGLARQWESRDRLFALAEAAPRTVSHLDVWPMNIMDDPDGSDGAVLLDWSFIGDGAVGEDIGNLVPDSVADGLMPADGLPEITEACVTGYLDGLRDGEWRGSPDEARRAIAVCGAAKYAWLAPMMADRLARGLAIGSPNYDRGDDNPTILERRRSMMELLADWTDQALG